MFQNKISKVALAIVCLAVILPGDLIVAAFDLRSSELYATQLRGALAEGSPCVMEDGSQGECIELPKCPMRIAEVKAGKRFSTSTGRCSFKNFVEIVCCPLANSKKPTTTSTPRPTERSTLQPINPRPDGNDADGRGNNNNDVDTSDWSKLGSRPAVVACRQYENEIIGENGEVVHTNIFSGINATEGEFPSMVALGYSNDRRNPRKIDYNCGGTLISIQHVLTAAHCVNNINNFVPVEVRLGSTDLEKTTEHVQRLPVGEIISHPRYKRSVNYYDIAIIKLGRKVNLSERVMPICLQTKPIPNLDVLAHMSLIATGWGATSFDDDGIAKLQKTPSLQLIDRIECAESYKGFSKLPNGLDDSMICILDKNVTRRADACQGDSGGPLLLTSRTTRTVLGVTSFGQSCGSSIPAVYTSVYYYLDWIEDTVWPGKRTT